MLKMYTSRLVDEQNPLMNKNRAIMYIHFCLNLGETYK